MKNIIFCINKIILCLIFCHVNIICFANDNIVNSIVIDYVNFELETPFNISPEQYETAFQDEIQHFAVNAAEGQKLLRYLQLLDRCAPKSVDVRIKITITYNNTRDIYYVGYFYAVKNNECYRLSKSFRNYLKKLCLVNK